MTVHIAQELVTIEQWSALAMNWPEDVRYELVEGRLVEMSWESGRNSKAALNLRDRLKGALPRAEWEILLGSGVTLALDPKGTVRIPDVRVLRKDVFNADDESCEFPATAVLLVAEFVSDSTTKTDRIDKRAEYERSGIPHYWIFDVRAKARGPRVQVFKLVDGQYQEQSTFGADGTINLVDPVALSFTLADLTD